MSQKHVIALVAVIGLAGALVGFLLLSGDRDGPTSGDDFSPYEDQQHAEAKEVADTGLAVPTASAERRAKTDRERRTEEKIERSREIARRLETEGGEPDDTLNRMGPTGEDALARRPPKDEEAGKLDKDVIQRGIEAVRPTVKACYEEALKDFPDAAGKVTIGFRIIGEDGEGRVELSELDPERTTLFDEKLHDCMLEGIGEAAFDVAPGGGGVVNVTYPFTFANDAQSPQDDE